MIITIPILCCTITINYPCCACTYYEPWFKFHFPARDCNNYFCLTHLHLVFLDLPSPWEAISSAKTAIKVRELDKRV